MRLYPLVLLLLIIAIEYGCSAGKIAQTVNNSEIKKTIPNSPRSVKGCYAHATILEILPDLNEKDVNDPCANVPCYARVRIDRVVNRGMECHNSVHGRAELKVFFSCSLVQTGEALFPGMAASYAGLKINDRFAATFLTYSRGDQEAITYKVTGYQKID
ncbi:MAG: hypothetical protein COB85_02600 [Bacteroidetes bacterium]|nr:MAG: hypothetical protein COB85_02600 [Bacteroidota bacterium]